MAVATAATSPVGPVGPPSATAPTLPSRTKQKLHGRAFYESIGSPKLVVAPMVDQSEFAWRMLIRSFLPPDQRASVLAYSPMLHARLFVNSPRYRTSHFEATKEEGDEGEGGIRGGAGGGGGLRPFLDGNPAIDRPLFVQFCANDPDDLLAAARRVAPYCDAVDLNLGCPQGIARKGHYGAFLQEEPELVARLVRTLHENLDIPVTAKIRVLDSPEASLRYARTVLDAGASILTVHGRRRDQKGHLTGLADWAVLRYLREHLPPDTVLFANGNILQPQDVARCLAATGFDGVMSAEGLLSNPGLFGPQPVPTPAPYSEPAPLPRPPPTDTDYYWHTPDPRREFWTSSHSPRRGGWRIDAVMRRYLDILHVYVLGAPAPPVRRPLFIIGDPVEWLEKGEEEEKEGAMHKGDAAEGVGLAGKKRKRENGKGIADAAAPNKDAVASSPNFVSVQAHLFHLLRHAVAKHHDIRDSLARTRKGDVAGCERILSTLERRVAQALLVGEEGDSDEPSNETASGAAGGAVEEAEEAVVDDPNSSAAAVRRCRRPWWVVQPILRPMPAEALAKGAIQLKKKAKAGLEAEAAAGKEAS